LLIGLTGPSGAHKSVAAKRLKKHGFVAIHAGDPVRDGVAAGHGLSQKDVKGKGKDRPNAKLAGAMPRAVMEAAAIGLHTVAPHATAQRVRKLASQHLMAGRSVVVDGVRSQHEAAAIKAMGGQVWRMDNGKGPNPNLPMDKRQAEVQADRMVDSSGSKSEVKGNVDQALMECFS
jgi:rhodanese-related sulfurtransferase